MKTEQGRKGVFFTLAIVLILIPLIILVSYHSMSTKTRVVDTTEKIRCDELHYFVEDVKKDLGRAGGIFGRRAAIYSIDYVIKSPGNPVENYSFNCSQECDLDCGKMAYPEKGAEAVIAELALCGTLNNTNVTYMINHTIKEWMRKIEERGVDKNFAINMSIREIRVTPMDAWNFSITVDSQIEVTDLLGICYYTEDRSTTTSNTSIVGLEDPLYTLGSEGKIIKYIDNCEPDLNLTALAGASETSRGNGNGTGTIIFYSALESATPGGAAQYCLDTPQEILETQILILPGGAVTCSDPIITSGCLDVSSPKHFGGLIYYGAGANIVGCEPTIPWISDTGDMDDDVVDTQDNPAPYIDCGPVSTISDGGCVYIRNRNIACGHQVIVGRDGRDLNLTCYTVSNATNYSSGCAEVYPNGPSFFDRLDGRYNLSERYVNQSLEYYNTPFIGIETMVDIYEIMDHSIEPLVEASRADYLYWKNQSGRGVCGVCSGQMPFRLDCQHAKKYGLEDNC